MMCLAKVAVSVLLVLVAPGAARASDLAMADADKVLEDVTAMNKSALQALQAGKHESARKTLKRALDACADAGLDKHPLKARTHIHMGAVLFGGFQQRDAAIRQFTKAIEIQPDIKLTKSIATPELQEVFEEAMLSASGGGGGEKPASEEPPASPPETDTPPPEPAVDGEETPAPRPAARRAPRRKKPADLEEEDETEGFGGTIFVGLFGGTGFGLASGDGETNPQLHKLGSPGLLMAQAGHVAPEIGFFLSPNWIISAQARIQIITGANGELVNGTYYAPYKSSFAVLGRIAYLAGSGGFRPFIGAALGGGYIRYVMEFTNAIPRCGEAGNQTCLDTIKGGGAIVGPFFGAIFPFGDHFGLALSINTHVAFPAFTFEVDGNAGIALAF